MSVFKSALNYFNETPNDAPQNEFVGQVVELGDAKVRVKKQIGEGGFAFVYVAQEVTTGKYFALKRLLSSDAEIDKTIRQEIALLKQLSGHQNIIKYFAAAAVDKSKSPHGRSEYLVVTELCTGGNLVDVLRVRGRALPSDTVCQVMIQTARAVQHLHSQTPPVLHRDLKIENLLIGDDGLIKLCDFGSATTKMHCIDHSWSASQRSMLEDEMAQHTTPMYRAPEMLDTWNNYPVNTQADIWALGCVLYMLCFNRHPFEDSAKLRITNGNYMFPEGDTTYQHFHALIKGMLQVDPAQRFTINDVLERLVAIAESCGIDARAPLKLTGVKVDTSGSGTNPAHPVSPARSAAAESAKGSSRPVAPPRPPPPSASASAAPAGGTGGLFSSLRGGAGSLLKNLVDTSKTVVHSVQQTMVAREMDISYITSRLVVMSYPAEGIESAYRNRLEDVRAALDARHQSNYCVYNISGRSYNPAKFPLVVEKNCMPGRSPTLYILYWLCQDISRFLQKDRRNVAVIHCVDGKATSALLLASLVMYVGLFEKPEQALNLFAVKRFPTDLSPSQLRYLDYIRQMTLPGRPILPHLQPVTITSVVMQPVPLFTRVRDGCRPYVELCQGTEIIMSTQNEYELIRHFNPADRKVVIPINVTLCGDITVHVYHARRVMGRLTGVRIVQAQFHSGFIDEEETSLHFSTCDLDHVTESDRYPPQFLVTVHVLVCEETDGGSCRFPLPWRQDAGSLRSQALLFTEQSELVDTQRQFANVNKPARPPNPVVSTGQRDSERASSSYTTSSDISHLPASAVSPPTQLTGSDSSDPDTAEAPASGTVEADLLGLGQSVDPGDTAAVNDPMRHFDTGISRRVQKDGGGSNSATELFDPFGLGVEGGGADSSSSLNTGVAGLHVSSSTADFRQPVSAAAGSSAAAMTSSGSGGLLLADWSGHGTSAAANIQRNASQPNLASSDAQQTGDLLGEWSQFATFGVNKSSVSSSVPGNSHSVGGSPVHAKPIPPTSSTNRAVPPGSSASKPVPPAMASTNKPAPNYSRAAFDSSATTKDNGGSGVRAPLGDDVFGDLLGSQGYAFTSKQDQAPKTMGQMKKAEATREMDPDQIKIMEWTEGKQRNVRALLCSLQQVVWPQCRWQGCSMNQLMTSTEVKKVYRRACLAVHPDKQTGTENEKLAKLIFMELNDAYSEFENDSTQQKMFQ